MRKIQSSRLQWMSLLEWCWRKGLMRMSTDNFVRIS
jgi:hypothetical protein